ncbi:hypothetical protein CNMCM8980_009378 [Aspergillus fumigatiaffinis]|uniref:Tat pathway signal sequence n=1 Tax=Aspergillus fumigatiaffinis TaxID=340414 RepID=A0A8H4H1P6_9EURO|nr:hypothetical protein CNMCM5878_003063 [Aspergillus fumigatiaffinis]KAF4224231.1 hypothetical protein CNMCM6457_009656 [Aspergillus fumigatiaffinis]KAF4232700.1 hypothetical protein CNMCM6805_009723 [Aspergillus fumigatiaffinis]KAF4245794.1 hypothetical protein CNMCM8980_009378 [Aspergillus fumigatiaffinis]
MAHSESDKDIDANYGLLNNEEAQNWSHDEKPRSRSHGGWLKAMLYIATAVVSCLVGLFIGGQVQDLDRVCTRHVSHYSPVTANVDITFQPQRFNGSLLKENIYRKDASPEVDAAWEALGANYRSLRVPAEVAEKSGLARDQVKINQKYGGGYPANVEGFHHLHCLNLLRQTLYYNYDYYHKLGQGAFKNDDFIVRRHVSHCLDILRQQLMCTIDTGVLGQVWIHPDHPEAYVDFNTEHQCKNFETIRQYAEKNQLPAQIPKDFLEPPKPGDRVYDEIP